LVKYTSSIDELIRHAMEAGEFDNLPGKGKPLDLSQNPYEDPDWRLAYTMLRSSGQTLPWIETRQAIEAELESVRESLVRSWNWRRSTLDQNQFYGVLENEWQRALATFKDTIADLNKRIFNYNLDVPSGQFKRWPINLEGEITKIITQSD
jgi:DnaJ family protein C protein 28